MRNGGGSEMRTGDAGGTRAVRRPGRSALALLAGFVVVVALSLGTDAALHATGVFPPMGQRMSDALFLLATVYRSVYGVLGSYVTARLAPDRPMQHALVGCALGLVLATVGTVATWNNGPEFGPALVSAFASRDRAAERLGGRLLARAAAARELTRAARDSDAIADRRPGIMKNAETLQVTTPSDQEIQITRLFDAPRELVFEAFTRPELLKRWLSARTAGRSTSARSTSAWAASTATSGSTSRTARRWG